MTDLINVPGSSGLHLAVADVQSVSAGGIYAALAQSKLTLGVKAVQLSGQKDTHSSGMMTSLLLSCQLFAMTVHILNMHTFLHPIQGSKCVIHFFFFFFLILIFITVRM